MSPELIVVAIIYGGLLFAIFYFKTTDYLHKKQAEFDEEVRRLRPGGGRKPMPDAHYAAYGANMRGAMADFDWLRGAGLDMDRLLHVSQCGRLTDAGWDAPICLCSNPPEFHYRGRCIGCGAKLKDAEADR